MAQKKPSDILPDSEQETPERDDEFATDSNGRADRGQDPPSPSGATTDGKPPTSELLSAARRARDYKREGRGSSRQLDITLRHTPISGVYFRIWPDPEAELPIALLKVKDDKDQKEVYVLSPAIADLPHIAPKVRDGSLVACVTSTGRVYVWARTEPDPNDRLGFRIFEGLRRAGEEARKGWVMISWDGGVLSISYPRVPIEDEPRWPNGQSLEEIYELAIRGSFIDKPDHPVIQRLDAITKEI